MMRRAIALSCALLVLACAPKDDQSDTAAADTAAAAAPAPPAGLTLADVTGTWSVDGMLESSDSVVAKYQLWAVGDTTQWKMKFDNQTDTIPVHVTSIAGDSMTVVQGPYKSALRKNVMVTTNTTLRLQNGQLIGQSIAHYNVKTADSVITVRLRGSRSQ